MADPNINGSTRMFFSVIEVADMFAISTKSVYRLLDRGLLKSSSALRHKRISKTSIEEFIANTTDGGNGKSTAKHIHDCCYPANSYCN